MVDWVGHVEDVLQANLKGTEFLTTKIHDYNQLEFKNHRDK